jgi:hypothetical protein
MERGTAKSMTSQVSEHLPGLVRSDIVSLNFWNEIAK